MIPAVNDEGEGFQWFSPKPETHWWTSPCTNQRFSEQSTDKISLLLKEKVHRRGGTSGRGSGDDATV